MEEGLRYAPSGVVVPRLASAEIVVCECEIPKGGHLTMFQWLTNRDPRCWDDPDKFDIHLMFVDPPILQDCIWRLQGLLVLFVTVKAPRDVLMHRQESRITDMPDEFAEQVGDSAQQVVAKTMQRLISCFTTPVIRTPATIWLSIPQVIVLMK